MRAYSARRAAVSQPAANPLAVSRLAASRSASPPAVSPAATRAATRAVARGSTGCETSAASCAAATSAASRRAASRPAVSRLAASQSASPPAAARTRRNGSFHSFPPPTPTGPIRRPETAPCTSKRAVFLRIASRPTSMPLQRQFRALNLAVFFCPEFSCFRPPFVRLYRLILGGTARSFGTPVRRREERHHGLAMYSTSARRQPSVAAGLLPGARRLLFGSQSLGLLRMPRPARTRYWMNNWFPANLLPPSTRL